MSAMSAKRVFAPPHPSLHRRRSSRNRKRKRQDHEGSSSSSSDDERNAAASNAIDSTITITTTDEIPPHPFPHAPAGRLGNADQTATAAAAAATQRPSNASFRRKNVECLTAVLHRCLLSGDYTRAARAWRMLLRIQIGGHLVDPRSQGWWGIGAEILLRQRGADGDAVTPATDDISSDTRSAFTLDGLRAARAYYERLILQYPYLRTKPSRVDALSFYPHFFSLWIYEVTETSRLARAAAAAALVEDRDRDDAHQDSSTSDRDTSPSDHHSHTTTTPRRARRRLADIHAVELAQARQIAARLDQLLLSPPTDRDPDLLHLRGMLALWIGDLLLPNEQQEQEEEEEEEEEAKMPGVEDYGYANDRYASVSEFGGGRGEEQNGLKARQVEVERAKAYFTRASESGALVWEGVMHLFEDEE